MFQSVNSVILNNLSLKYQRFKPSGCKDIEIRKFEFVAKTCNSFTFVERDVPKYNDTSERTVRKYIIFVVLDFCNDPNIYL